jgi:hypothetical protein
MFGSNPPPVMSVNARRLKTTDPRTVAKYNAVLEEELTKHNVYSKALKLYNECRDTITHEQAEQYNELDRIREESMKTAEKKCRKLHLGAVPWTPEIGRVRKVIQYIKLRMRKLKGRRVGARTLIRLQKKAQVNFQTLSECELKQKLDVVYKYYKKLKKKAVDLRESFLDSLAHALEAYGKGSKAKIIEGIIKMEAQRRSFLKLKPLSKRFSENLSTTSVIINQDGETKELTRKSEMEREIIKENRKKFHQSEATCPFLQSPLCEEFGSFGESKIAEEVMNGTYNPGTDQVETSFFNACKLTTPTTPMNRSVEEFRDS